MQWFKFYGAEYLIDPKMQTLSCADRSCWLTLLSYASAADDNGRIRHLTEERLMIQAGVESKTEEWDKTKGVLKLFETLQMVLLESNGDITVSNWDKRQNTFLTNAERQKRYRERQKSNATVTTPLQDSNARERERERERKNSLSDTEKGEMIKNMASAKKKLLAKKVI